jgi:hypothetical protein
MALVHCTLHRSDRSCSGGSPRGAAPARREPPPSPPASQQLKVDAAYALEQAETAAYSERTERNVLASDGTAVFGDARSPGSMLTAHLCQRHGKPSCMIPLDDNPSSAAARLRAWLAEHRIRTLNVAGNRASQAPGIAAFVTAVLERALGNVTDQRGT